MSSAWPTEYKAGYGENPLPLSGLASFQSSGARPFVVFIDEKAEPEEEDELLRKMFGSEDVVIASRLFNCYRMKAEDIPDTTLRKKYGAKTPSLFFFGADGEEISAIRGKSSPRSVMSRLKKLYASHYEGSLARFVKKYEDTLSDMEKAEDGVANAKTALALLEERFAKKDNLTKKHEQDLADAKAELEAAEKALEALRVELAELADVKVKGADEAEATAAAR